jgi:hypothetical protein
MPLLIDVSTQPFEKDAGLTEAFSVNGSTFLNKAAALGRSCDVQKNGW